LVLIEKSRQPVNRAERAEPQRKPDLELPDTDRFEAAEDRQVGAACARAGRRGLSGAFATHGPYLECAGYQPVPVEPGGKAPVIERWGVPAPVASLLPKYARCSVGILTARTPALDIDIRIADLAADLHALAVRRLGDGPWRVGQAPKRLIVYRTCAPFTKLTSSAYVLPGDDLGAPGYKPHRIEILGVGQQFVAFGQHPSGSPYIWPDDSLLDTAAEDLPEIGADAAGEFIAEAERVIRLFGGKIHQCERRKRPGHYRHGPLPRPVANLAEAQMVIDALRRLPNNEVGYYLWLDVGYALKAALGEKAGWPLFRDWSAQAHKNAPYETKRTWKYISPSKCGWRFLERIVEGQSHARG
jgi:hypothetical protein